MPLHLRPTQATPMLQQWLGSVAHAYWAVADSLHGHQRMTQHQQKLLRNWLQQTHTSSDFVSLWYMSKWFHQSVLPRDPFSPTVPLATLKSTQW